ncbi:MAG: hypothetical protein Q8880_00830 [Bacteroidota bacterium]|nr:hypothetical protein [Bacteroidota bacterium]
MRVINFILIFILFPVSCKEHIDKVNINSFLFEPAMIVNYEQDNTIEGKYLIAKDIFIKDSIVSIKIPDNFYINKNNCRKWIIGWGNNKPLYDAGVENLRTIEKIDNKRGIIFLGKILRGSGFPIKNQRIVFWNTKPSGFINSISKPIIKPSGWPEFCGSSASFSTVVYDSLLGKWIMIFNECDTNKIQIYAAMSDNLTDWKPANKGNPILKVSDFKNCSWAGRDKNGNLTQTPIASDIIRCKNKWYLFLDGYDCDGKRHIGIAITDKTLIGPFKIINKPILSPGTKNTWNDQSCFYAKVQKYKDHYIMFYDGSNHNGHESIGMATSKNLISWNNYEKNPVIDQHTGWRSSKGTSEPNYIETRNDSIFLLISGAKKFKIGFWHHYLTKRMYLDKSGNVDDTQSGLYMSTNEGKSFTPYNYNPVFVNDYSNIYENEHLGGNIKLIKTDTADFLFYQAKSSYRGMKYNIMLRTRKK